jgi:hypothetical protein
MKSMSWSGTEGTSVCLSELVVSEDFLLAILFVLAMNLVNGHTPLSNLTR